jgi:hypothetical protein
MYLSLMFCLQLCFGSAIPSNCKSLNDGVDPKPFKYYIITNKELAPGFEKLAAWKTRKELPTKIVTTDVIYSTFDGIDRQEKIRNFIGSIHRCGAEYVLLGGDDSIVPVRIVYQGGLDNPTPPQYDKPACDLYYSDLDGTWDADGDNIYGELASDSVDLNPDICVGRISVESSEECAAFVDKVLTYERNPAKNYVRNTFIGAVAVNGAETDADSLAAVFSSGWNLNRMYESKKNLTVANFTKFFNDGFGLGFLISHGYENEIRFSSTERFSEDKVDLLTNVGKYPVVAAANCRIGAFDAFGGNVTDCMVEKLMYRKNGGTVAFIANSRMGSQAKGATQEYISDFYRSVITENQTTLGRAFSSSLAGNIVNAKMTTEHCYAFYNLNLHGDPSMEIWTDEPKTMELTIKNNRTEKIGFTIGVQDGNGIVDGALVTIMWAGDSVIENSSHTDPSGKVSFEFVPKTDFDSVWITVIKKNYLPVLRSVSRDMATSAASGRRRSGVIDCDVANIDGEIRLTFDGTADRPYPVEISVFDLAGRMLYKKETRFEPGTHSILLEGKSAPMNGVRVVKLKTADVVRIMTVSGY